MNNLRMLVLSLTLTGCVGGDSGKPDTSGDSDTSSAAPTATDIEDLGCGDFSGEVITPTSEASGRIDVLHTDYLQGCCPDGVEVAVATEEMTLNVTYTPTNDVCDCVCGLDVRYAIVGVPAGSWTITSTHSGASASVSVP